MRRVVERSVADMTVGELLEVYQGHREFFNRVYSVVLLHGSRFVAPSVAALVRGDGPKPRTGQGRELVTP
nr:hypothetical protein [Pelobacter propionicus]